MQFNESQTSARVGRQSETNNYFFSALSNGPTFEICYRYYFHKFFTAVRIRIENGLCKISTRAHSSSGYFKKSHFCILCFTANSSQKFSYFSSRHLELQLCKTFGQTTLATGSSISIKRRCVQGVCMVSYCIYEK